jgi:hypothetical protein
MKQRVLSLNKHLDDLIKNADGEPYKGTSFKKDMGRKFGVHMGPKNLPDEKTDSEKRMNMKDSMGKTKGLSSLNLDLFADYGFGIQAWIRMLLNLFCLYAFLSIFAGCIMMLY